MVNKDCSYSDYGEMECGEACAECWYCPYNPKYNREKAANREKGMNDKK